LLTSDVNINQVAEGFSLASYKYSAYNNLALAALPGTLVSQ